MVVSNCCGEWSLIGEFDKLKEVGPQVWWQSHDHSKQPQSFVIVIIIIPLRSEDMRSLITSCYEIRRENLWQNGLRHRAISGRKKWPKLR